jgi:hypothetical protein
MSAEGVTRSPWRLCQREVTSPHMKEFVIGLSREVTFRLVWKWLRDNRCRHHLIFRATRSYFTFRDRETMLLSPALHWFVIPGLRVPPAATSINEYCRCKCLGPLKCASSG